ncbi:M48 family metallopeptidase [Luteimonas aquatica]|uniref:M48 family metallopeptidase n=1 Tax=Luteimonas aquatica TaxID=450364 RepID=UPI001F59A952|nr:M48 family metallopeptidase [Luteimonas aquatica]
MAAQARYAALIERLQGEARRAPGRYRFKLALLALAGYGVLLALLAITVGVPLLVLAAALATGRWDPALVFVVLSFGLIGAVLLRALWMPAGAPSGYRLGEGEAPRLTEDVERLRAAVGAPPLSGIVIDSELNAAAAQVPRLFGLLGNRQYLVLGLPLLQLLDREELASVIAHEFGHFGAEHGRFSGWIYRVRLSWYRVLEGMAQRGGIVAHLLFKFYERYVPYFNAYSFVLAREQEYEADAAAARATGAEAAASALVRLELAQARLQRTFWPQLSARMPAQPQPPRDYHQALARVLRVPMACDQARLLDATARDAALEDTHPPLPQRVAALGVPPRLLASRGEAASELLGAALPQIERALDARWHAQADPQWREAYRAAAGERARLAEIESRGAPTPAETLEHARLVEKLRPDYDAAPLYARAIALEPGNATAHYRAGMLALRGGDARAGIAQLRQAMSLDAGAVRPILAELEACRRDPGLDAAVAAELRALHEAFAPSAQSLDARDAVAVEDGLLAHDLDAEALRGLARVLALQERVTRAWVARKRLELADGTPHYVVLVDWRGSVASEAAGLKRLSEAFRLPGSHSVFTGTDQRAMARRVRQLCAEPVYQRAR